MSVQRFAILSMPRSGTNYFISRLVRRPRLIMAWEPFNTEVDWWLDPGCDLDSAPRETRECLGNVGLRNADPESFYERAFSPRSKLDLGDANAIGFKIFPCHNADVYWRLSREQDYKIIVLERRNRLLSFSSQIIAHNTGEWSGDGLGPQQRFAFDPYAFRMYSRLTDFVFASTLANLKDAGVLFRHFIYENFTDGSCDLKDAHDFLNLAYTEDPGSLSRQNSTDPLDRFTNPDEAEAFLSVNFPEFLCTRL